jgi:hypothetical protein
MRWFKWELTNPLVAARAGTGGATGAIEWQAMRLSDQEALAVRASKKLRSDELLLTGFASSPNPCRSIT